MRRVLLLNITYEPLTTVCLPRAVCLVLGEKAEVVHEDADGRVLHSASAKMAAPSVIKLRRYVRVPYRSRGGTHAWENCVASCTRCNHGKADRLIEELGWSLRCVPVVPRGAHWRLIGAAHDGDPQWAAYLARTSAA